MQYNVLKRFDDAQDGHNRYDPAKPDEGKHIYPRKGLKPTQERCKDLCKRGYIEPMQGQQPEPEPIAEPDPIPAPYPEPQPDYPPDDYQESESDSPRRRNYRR